MSGQLLATGSRGLAAPARTWLARMVRVWAVDCAPVHQSALRLCDLMPGHETVSRIESLVPSPKVHKSTSRGAYRGDVS